MFSTFICTSKAAEKMNNCVCARGWPLGKLVGKSDGLTELLHIPNSAKVVNIKDPQPGMWSIKVNNSYFYPRMCVNYFSQQIPRAERSFIKTYCKWFSGVTLE